MGSTDNISVIVIRFNETINTSGTSSLPTPLD
jgi:hypothetical protein